MDAMQEEAAKRAGLTLKEAFSIDAADPPLASVLGEDALRAWADALYASAYADEEAWFRFVGASLAAGRSCLRRTSAAEAHSTSSLPAPRRPAGTCSTFRRSRPLSACLSSSSSAWAARRCFQRIGVRRAWASRMRSGGRA